MKWYLSQIVYIYIFSLYIKIVLFVIVNFFYVFTDFYVFIFMYLFSSWNLSVDPLGIWKLLFEITDFESSSYTTVHSYLECY